MESLAKGEEEKSSPKNSLASLSSPVSASTSQFPTFFVSLHWVENLVSRVLPSLVAKRKKGEKKVPHPIFEPCEKRRFVLENQGSYFHEPEGQNPADQRLFFDLLATGGKLR